MSIETDKRKRERVAAMFVIACFLVGALGFYLSGGLVATLAMASFGLSCIGGFLLGYYWDMKRHG